LIGIGKESDGSNTSANDRDKLTIENPSQLDNGEYFLVAHNDSGYASSSNVPAGYTSRWKQTWRAAEVGEVGKLKVSFYVDADSLTSKGEYVLLVDNDGDFSNGGTRHYKLTDSLTTPLTLDFDGVNINDGEHFTLAKKMSGIESITDGSWNDPTTWNCLCVPNSTDNVDINHSVIIDSNVNVLTAELNNNGTLIFNGSDTLFVHGNFENNGALISGNGTVAAVGVVVQTFFNSTLNTVELNNLLVNNDSGLNIASGDWAIRNNIQVLSGILKNNGANSITFISNASTNSQILSSVEDAFEGDFTVQRFISGRKPNYGNISSPVENATFNDLDNALYISGANGLDSNTTTSDGRSTFYSLFNFNNRTNLHEAIKDINQPMIPTYGYEVYLISVLSYFNPTVINFVGTPNSGNLKLTYNNLITKGWNLIGNPYHAHVAFDSLLAGRISNSYYIFNTDNGAYELISGSSKRPIAPSQGFWVYRANGGGYYITFKESYKLDNNSNAFYRNKNINERLSLKITSSSNQYNQTLYLNFNHASTENIDELDIPILHSPIQEAPAIYSKALNSKEELVVNSLNPVQNNQMIPVSIYAGEEGEYEITADHLSSLYDKYSCVYLKDKETNTNIDLMVEPKYAFSSTKGKYDRFNLILSNSYEDCHHLLDEGSFEQNLNEQLSLRNAYKQWFVDYTLGEEITQLEVRIYNMQGQLVKATESFQANGAGTYQLQNTENLKGIYLIQVVGKNHFVNQRIKF
ncbi:MAG TPA: T9SS type A sorting domain-containing protein, partial [Marinilabiliaceae bacterium]|nr:T9SS type A sorting domain-containing protein [Marinilabiliaceae bacterium]